MGGAAIKSRQISAFLLMTPDGLRDLKDGEETENYPGGELREKSFPSRGDLVLYPFGTVSAHPFSFPFRSMKDISNALSLRFLPLLSGEENVEIVPWVKKTGNGLSAGAAFCIASSEIPGGREDGFPADHHSWPLPLALASAVNGSGIAVYRDGQVGASAVFEDGVPLLCRSGVSAQWNTDDEIRLCREYCLAGEKEALAAEPRVITGREELLKAARETVARFPEYLEIDLSRPALDAARARERTARALWRLSAAAALFGTVFSVFQYTLFLRIRSSIDLLASESAALYRETAGGTERIVDPLSQARGKLAALKGDGDNGDTLTGFLSHLGSAWSGEKDGKETFPVLEQMRYAGEGADLTGTAQSMESIQSLRRSLDSGGFQASLGDIQQVPGGGLRFSLSLRRREE